MAQVQTKSVRRIAGALSLTALALCLSTGARAQDSTAANTAPRTDQTQVGLEEIVVIGNTKQLQNTLDVPITITAFSGEDLEAKSASQISDVATYTPGFAVTQAPSNATALSLAIRGQVQNDVLATLEPSVGTYVDDLYWGRAYGLNAGLLDLASAQVLKGPQGTLFGRNTTGGALVLTSADPDTSAFSGRAAITYGRFNEMTGEAIVNVPVTSNFALRGAFRISGRDGWAYGVRTVDGAGNINNSSAAGNVVVPNGRKYNDRQELQGRLKALFEISGSTDLVLAGEWYDFKMDGPGRQLLYKVKLNTPGGAGDVVTGLTAVRKYEDYFKDHPNAVGVDSFECSYALNPALNCNDMLLRERAPYTDVHTSTYSARLTSDVGFGTFKLVGGYRNIFSDTFIDLDGSGTLIHGTSLTQDLSQWSVEANLAGAILGDALDYVLGATYFHEDGYDLSYSLTGSNGNAPGRATRNYGFIDNDAIGIYGQVNWHLSDSFTAYGGVRYSKDTKRLDIRSANVNLLGQLTGLGGNVFPAGYVPGGFFDPCNGTGAGGGVGLGTITGADPANDCSVDKTAKFDAISWTAGLDFKPTEDILVYAKVSKGFRSGGHNLRAFNDAQFAPFEPETVLEEEVGIKAELLDRRVRISVAGYHNKINDAQRSTIVTTGSVSNTIVGNAAKVRNYGVEAELLVRPFDGLTLSASGSINDAKYLSYADAIGDRTNERFTYVPKKKFALGAQYETSLSDRLSATLNVDYAWTGKYASDECSLTGASACWAGSGDLDGQTTIQISQAIIDATTIPSAGLLGARLTFGFDEDKYKLSFWGRNLTNDRGIVQALILNAPQRNYTSGLRRDPATYGVTLSASF